ncbi:MAG: hypothetical protein HYY44_07685 [Deltaproteobacteria bacterium]|nr:hypothetical protein [Deltaproteobacteria bacterium]MBI4373843.1 hypothetical protein [Deltaproteobacteria bacterium]
MIFVRLSAAILVLVLGVLAVSYMQARFDEGDLTRAILAVQKKVPGAEKCEGEVASRFRGQVRVRCWQNNQEQEWLVDLVRSTIGGMSHGS